MMDITSSGEPRLNPGVDVRNGIDDYLYRQEVQRMQSSFDLIVANGNMDYNESLNLIIRRNIEEQRNSGVSMSLKRMIPDVGNAVKSTALVLVDKMNSGHLSETELSEALKEAFAKLTNVNVSDYINKPEITYEDEEILNRYNEFCDEVLARMQHEYATGAEYEYQPYEMAMYALHVYDDDPARGFDEWCLPLGDANSVANIEEREPVQKILDFLRENNDRDGFQAELYYDKDAEKYILAFRGTEARLADFLADGSYLKTGKSPQHDKASALGELILKSGIPADKLTITGHSLGGSLALIAGVTSGVETYTFNPLHLNTEAVNNYGLDIVNKDNIHNYSEFRESLVGGGEGFTMAAKTIHNANPVGFVENLSEGNIGLWHPVDVGESISVVCPHSSFDPSNHKMGNLIQGVAAHGGDKTSNYIHGRNMRQAISRMRAEKPYRQATTTIRISAGGLEFKKIERN